MLEIKVTVDAPAIADACHHLASAIEKRAEIETKKINLAGQIADKAPLSEGYGQPEPAVAAPENTTLVPAEATTENVTPVTPAPSPAALEKSYTIEELGNAGAALIELGKMQDLINLLGKYGVQSIVQLNGKGPDVIMSFAADLKALGAKL